MLEIDQVIDAFKNGKWHNLDDITRVSKLSEPNVKTIVRFLAEYNFIEINDNRRKVKITPSLQRFLHKSQ